MSSDKGIDWGRVEKYDVGCKVDKLSLTVAKSGKESDEDNQVNFPSEPSCEKVHDQIYLLCNKTQLDFCRQPTHGKDTRNQSYVKVTYGKKGKTVTVVSFVLGVDCKVNSITVQT